MLSFFDVPGVEFAADFLRSQETCTERSHPEASEDGVTTYNGLSGLVPPLFSIFYVFCFCREAPACPAQEVF